jgi:hypothetical protein
MARIVTPSAFVASERYRLKTFTGNLGESFNGAARMGSRSLEGSKIEGCCLVHERTCTRSSLRSEAWWATTFSSSDSERPFAE